MTADLDLNPFDLLTRAFSFVLEKLQAGFDAVPILHSIGSVGLAIIALTLILRSLLFPIFAWQIRTMRRSQTEMARIQPEMTELKKKYKGQPQKFQAEMQKLYREHGVSPTSSLQGCFPTVIQGIIVWPLYNAIRSLSNGLHTDLGFLWIPNVSQSAHDGCCAVAGGHIGWFSGLVQHPGLLIVPLIAAIATFVQSRMMLVPASKTASAQQQSLQGMSTQMTLVIPFVILVTALNFAEGIGLYWVTQSLYMIIQQYYLFGWGGINAPRWVPGSHRVTHLTHEDHRAKRTMVQPTTGPTTPTNGSGVAVKNGNNLPAAALVARPEQPRTRAMAEPTGSPSRNNKGSGARKKRR